MTCCIEVWTPTKILECVEDDAGEPVDCFAQAVPSGSYHDLMVSALWQRYRFAVIDSLNVERWLIQIKDRADYIQRKYTKIMEAYDSNDVADMRMGWTDTTDSTDEASSTGSDTFRTENEDLPQTANPTGQWLTGRTTSTSTPGTKDTVTRHSTVKHDVQDMLMSEEFGRLMDTMRDPLHAYTEEFGDLFANRWG